MLSITISAVAYTFTILQKAFITNPRWQVLIQKLPRQSGASSDLYDLPGGKLAYEESLRESLNSAVNMETGLILTTVSVPLNVTTYLDWIDRSQQIVRIIYLCISEGQLNPGDKTREYLWIDSSQYSQYLFPDEGYKKAFETYSTHSQLASSEFLGLGILSDTTQYLRSKKTTPLI
ncbi:MAG: Dihydroneopterin triphosphate pyrophosphohydolase, partial [Candidatus Amesbacteria bacterium GW2011_GWC1_47_15]